MKIKELKENLQLREYSYPLADKINPLLYEQIKELNDPSKKPPNINAQFTGWHLKSKEVNTIVQWVNNLLDTYWTKVNGELYHFRCTEVWGVLYKEGDYISPHQHSPSIYSFVYYVTTPKGSSPLVFSTSGKRIKPVAGNVVLFESRLLHEVPRNKCSERCVISGNFIYPRNSGTLGIY